MCFGENNQGCYCCRRTSHNDDDEKYISSDNEIIVIGKTFLYCNNNEIKNKLKKKYKVLPSILISRHFDHSKCWGMKQIEVAQL